MMVGSKSRRWRVRAGVAIALALVCAVLVAVLHADVSSDAVAIIDRTRPEAPYDGVLSIPSAGVKVPLYILRDGCGCGCNPGLYGGGIIWGGDAADWAGVELDDTARIRSDDANAALELIEITDCIRLGDWLIGSHGVVRPNGDVLLCVQRTPSWRIRVYRWTML